MAEQAPIEVSAETPGKRRGWTPEQAREAGRKGARVAAERRAAGLPPKSAGDAKPGTRKGPGRPRGPSKSATTKAIADALAEILTMPAVPCAVLGDDWAAQHFTTQGRELAEKVARVSERNDVLRRWCERALEGESVAVLLMGSIMYLYPPLLHWGIVPGPAGLFGVPERPERRRRRQPIVPPPPPPPPASVGDGLGVSDPSLFADTVNTPDLGNGAGPVGPDDLADVSVHMVEDEPPAETSW